MTTSDGQVSTAVTSAQLAKERAALELKRAQTMSKAIKLAALWPTLGAIYIVALLTHQDPSFIKWLGGSLFAIGLFGWILL